MSCQPQQCPPHAPLPASTWRGWPEARSGTCIPRSHASPFSAQCPPSTQKAGPLLCRPHPTRERGLWTRALGAQSQLRHPSPTRAGKFAGGGPQIPQPAPAASKRAQDLSHTILHPYPGPTPPRSGPRSGPQKQLDPPGGGGGRHEGSRSRPLLAGARTRRPGQRRPRAFTEPRAQQQERRGTYCASAGRLPRPLSPKRRRRRGAAAVRAGALSAAGLGLGLGLGLRLGRHRPADSEARGGLCARRARRADTAPRGGAARGKRCHSCLPHHTPCPPRAGRGPGARARGRRRATGAAGRGAGAQSAGRRAHSGANPPAPRWPGQSIIHSGQGCARSLPAPPPRPPSGPRVGPGRGTGRGAGPRTASPSRGSALVEPAGSRACARRCLPTTLPSTATLVLEAGTWATPHPRHKVARAETCKSAWSWWGRGGSPAPERFLGRTPGTPTPQLTPGGRGP